MCTFDYDQFGRQIFLEALIKNSLPKFWIDSENWMQKFENWLSYLKFNEINSANIANRDRGNFVNFGGIFAAASACLMFELGFPLSVPIFLSAITDKVL